MQEDGGEDLMAFPDKLGAALEEIADGVKFDHFPIENTLVFLAALEKGSHINCTLKLGNGDDLNLNGKLFKLISEYLNSLYYLCIAWRNSAFL